MILSFSNAKSAAVLLQLSFYKHHISAHSTLLLGLMVFPFISIKDISLFISSLRKFQSECASVYRAAILRSYIQGALH